MEFYHPHGEVKIDFISAAKRAEPGPVVFRPMRPGCLTSLSTFGWRETGVLPRRAVKRSAAD